MMNYFQLKYYIWILRYIIHIMENISGYSYYSSVRKGYRARIRSRRSQLIRATFIMNVQPLITMEDFTETAIKDGMN